MATRRIAFFLTAAWLTLSLAGCGASGGAGNAETQRTEISADDAIESVETLGSWTSTVLKSRQSPSGTAWI